ncbi:Pentalenene synthase [Minicystis rosea]|nr:Pentalenene synthase [Minicystis rosea]
MIEPTSIAETGQFYCPIAAAVHPRAAAVAERSLEWLIRMGLGADERQRRRALAANGAEFYGRITPDGDDDRLSIAADWIYWAGFFDDTRCDEDEARGRGFTDLVARLLRMLETMDARLAGRDPCLAALHDLGTRFARVATPVQMNRWVEAHRKWLFGVVQRRAHTAGGVMPDLDTYLTMRLHDAAGAPITSMIEMVAGLEVPSREMDSPRVRALSELGAMIGALDNDRISRFKEAHEGDEEQNLLRVIAHARGGTAEQALAELVALRDRMMCIFLRLRDQATESASPALRRYLEDLGHMIRGHIDWSFTTARYSTLYSASGARRVSLSMRWTDEPADACLEAPPLPSIAWWWAELTP